MPSSNRRVLFDPDLVDEYIEQQIVDRPTDVDDIKSTVEDWISPNTSEFSERNLQQSFNNDIFDEILGYRGPRPGSREFQLFPEELAEGGEGFPDVLLGHFEQSDTDDEELETDIRKVVGELKGPGTDLDKVDPSRLKSPVEQGFKYAITNGLAVRWVIVSNMEEIRLYRHGSIDHYEVWEIDDFLDDGELTDLFWEFYFITHREYLIGAEDSGSRIESLLAQNLSNRLELTEEFYGFYRDAVEDVYNAIMEERANLVDDDEQIRVIQASQKLIHRGLVICFFSDHPAELLPDDLLEGIVNTGKNLPSLAERKIYPLLQDLFTVLDEGSPEQYPRDIFGYDGGLFEPDSILSETTLPDELFTKDYEINGTVIEGVYGFHIYDFQKDLNEHVLGRIFEESVGDIERVRATLEEGSDDPFARVSRSDYGLFFTREGLTEFVAQHVIQDLLQDKRTEVQDQLGLTGDEIDPENPDRKFLEEYLNEIINIRIADIACGSGAFLVSCFNHLSREARNVFDKVISAHEGQVQLQSFNQTEIDILDQCLHGNDILQEAIEISKLSVWLRSARKNTSLAVLTGNFASQDALAGEIQFEEQDETAGFEEFDLIIGNPPWGGGINADAQEYLINEFDAFNVNNLDTFELFVLTALKYLKPNGRLAYVLPQTILRSEHEPIRQHLLDNYTFERFHVMGADWFGSEIRMNTVTLQLKNRDPPEGNTFRSMTLVDEDRRKAIAGELSLPQLESAYSFKIPQDRCRESGEIEPFRYVTDDELLGTMERHSIPVGAFCESHRGVELNKQGRVIRCPSCGVWMKPPRSTDPDAQKECPECSLEFEYQDRLAEKHLTSDEPADGDVPYMDGDSFGGRYDPIELLGLDLGYAGVNYKDRDIYTGNKLFIREAGVGLSVAYNGETVYCPRSVYIYRIRSDRDAMIDWYKEDIDRWADPDDIPDGLNTATYHKFLLGVLNSRVLHYHVFKRSGEIDAAQAFANMRQRDIRALPVPVVKLSTDEGQRAAEEIAACVDEMEASSDGGSKTDWKIDRLLLDLYGLDNEDMLYITQQMGLAAYHKKMQELYPDGKPHTPERKNEISLNTTAAEADD